MDDEILDVEVDEKVVNEKNDYDPFAEAPPKPVTDKEKFVEINKDEAFAETPPEKPKDSEVFITADDLVNEFEEATKKAPKAEVLTADNGNEEIIKELEPEIEVIEEKNSVQIDKEKMLENTHNLAEDIKMVQKEEEEEPVDDTNVAIFIAFIFIFLAIFVMALPMISRVFN